MAARHEFEKVDRVGAAYRDCCLDDDPQTIVIGEIGLPGEQPDGARVGQRDHRLDGRVTNFRSVRAEARYHRVAASLPYFIPLPAGWGTLGAVIAMRDRIRSRNALFDIGASGPLAGLVIALPALAWGLVHSPVKPMLLSGYQQEGQSLLYLAMKRVLLGPIPEGYDVQLHPTAAAGWFGLLVTMVNLLPWGQLDGGHIAFSLFGERQHHLDEACVPETVVRVPGFAGRMPPVGSGLRFRMAQEYWERMQKKSSSS